ncbi:hypothetical protein EOS_33145 [Caballeronia mineralivorans PML1(12)]|uniref:Uncharacterized protein n=1 Tax=Caballeronia mineralivorans PML1(12) TaxID=908627 RepID=A0A0J1CMN5_9BURK|nr:hypothetical protein [Caballeronia mineralivorans]KLU21987.1 hypothetical protein EOS_33145 [Caballeronia mineralivorans PML1(12)]
MPDATLDVLTTPHELANSVSSKAIVCVLVWSEGHDGMEKIALLRDTNSSWSLPKAYIQSSLVNDRKAVLEAVKLSVGIDLQKIVHRSSEQLEVGDLTRVYWHARLKPGQACTVSSNKLDWMSPQKAFRMMNSRDDEEALLLYIATRPHVIDVSNRYRSSFVARQFASPNGLRLLGDLRRVSTRLSAYPQTRAQDLNYYATQIILARALMAFYQNDYGGSWKCLGDALRRELFLMNKDDLASQCKIIKEQGLRKLDGWRLDAFRDIMKLNSEKISPALLSQASWLIADSQETAFYSIQLIQRQVNVIVTTLVVSSGLFLLNMNALGALNVGAVNFSVKQLTGSFLLGAIGACVSTLIALAGPQKLRIPDRLMNSVIAFARPFVGGGSALISSFFLMSGVIATDRLSLPLIYVVAFAFGFSERLVISTVSRLDK